MNVDVTGQLCAPRHVKAIENIVGDLVRLQDVFQPPNLALGAEINALPRCGDAHGHGEACSRGNDDAVRAHANEQQIARRVGRTHKPDAIGNEPIAEPAGILNLDPGRILRTGRLCR
jgi:hypothetical protein